jgi:hypothetical protein
MSWWWMSFCDPKKPKGSKFLGGLLIEARDHHDMMHRSWSLKLNPGGEVRFFEVPKEYEERITSDITYRLLSREECEAFERKHNQ